jgi:hypothetical protein
MRFSTMTPLFNAPSRLTVPLPSTPVQTQRTGKIDDSDFLVNNYPQKILEDQFPRLLQSEYDRVRMREIAEEVTPNLNRTLKIYYYDPQDPSKQGLKDYQKWLDALVEGLRNNRLDYTIEHIHDDPNINDYILGIKFSRYNRTALNSLIQLLTKKLP